LPAPVVICPKISSSARRPPQPPRAPVTEPTREKRPSIFRPQPALKEEPEKA
jgi:hypothetical protein